MSERGLPRASTGKKTAEIETQFNQDAFVSGFETEVDQVGPVARLRVDFLNIGDEAIGESVALGPHSHEGDGAVFLQELVGGRQRHRVQFHLGGGSVVDGIQHQAALRQFLGVVIGGLDRFGGLDRQS